MSPADLSFVWLADSATPDNLDLDRVVPDNHGPRGAEENRVAKRKTSVFLA
jgi:hypothetical protein